jgi:hypothetical protein
VLRRILGLRWEEVTGDWGKLHNEKLHLFTKFLSSKSKKDEMGKACGMYEGKEKYGVLVRKGC